MFIFRSGNIFRILVSAIILAITFFSVPAFSVDSKMQMSGESFSSACTRADESWISFCNGYIQAVVDGIREDDRICMPKGTTRTDLVTITEQKITNSQELKLMNAHDAVKSVLRSIYSCR